MARGVPGVGVVGVSSGVISRENSSSLSEAASTTGPFIVIKSTRGAQNTDKLSFTSMSFKSTVNDKSLSRGSLEQLQ